MSTGMVSGDVLHAQHDGGGRIPVRVFPTERDVRAIYQKPQNQGRFWRDGVLKWTLVKIWNFNSNENKITLLAASF